MKTVKYHRYKETVMFKLQVSCFAGVFFVAFFPRIVYYWTALKIMVEKTKRFLAMGQGLW